MGQLSRGLVICVLTGIAFGGTWSLAMRADATGYIFYTPYRVANDGWKVEYDGIQQSASLIVTKQPHSTDGKDYAFFEVSCRRNQFSIFVGFPFKKKGHLGVAAVTIEVGNTFWTGTGTVRDDLFGVFSDQPQANFTKHQFLHFLKELYETPKIKMVEVHKGITRERLIIDLHVTHGIRENVALGQTFSICKTLIRDQKESPQFGGPMFTLLRQFYQEKAGGVS